MGLYLMRRSIERQILHRLVKLRGQSDTIRPSKKNIFLVLWGPALRFNGTALVRDTCDSASESRIFSNLGEFCRVRRRMRRVWGRRGIKCVRHV